MKYQRFEDLPVWKSGIQLAAGVYALTERAEFQKRYSLRDQIERAAVSVSNNIAEGFERGSKQELLTFLYIARGSAGEVRSMLHLLDEIPAFRNLGSESRDLKGSAESISRQLGAWIRTLRDSEMKGERYVNEKTRRTDQKTRARQEFLEELERIRAGGADLSIQDSKFQIQDVGHTNHDVGHNNQDVGHNNQDVGHNNQGVGHNNQGVGHNNQGVGHNNQGVGHNNQDVGHKS